jgi:PAS domain S-box-containing protein
MARATSPATETGLVPGTSLESTLIESSPDCIKVLDMEGNLLSMSAGGQRLLEIRDIGRHLHHSWVDFWTPEDRPRIREAINLAREGQTGHFQAYCPSESGTPHWWDVLIRPIHQGALETGKLLAVSRDITAQKETERLLHQSRTQNELLYRTVAHSLSDIIYEWNLDDDVQWHGTTEVLASSGFGTLPCSRKEWIERMHDTDRAGVELSVQRHLQGGIPFACEYRIRVPNGEWRHWTDRGTVLRVSDGHSRWVGSISDTTEQVTARQALAESESRYRKLYDTMRDAFVSVDMDGKIIECNQAYVAMLGYPPEELALTTYVQITPEKWHAMETGIVTSQVLPRGYSNLYEKEYTCKDGRIVPVELRTILITDGAGVPTGMWAIVRDISARKKAEERYRVSQQRFRSTFEQAAVGIAHVAPDGHWIRLNQRFCSIVGYPMEELLSTTFQQITHPDDLDKDLELVRQVLDGERKTYSMEKRYIRKDGSLVWVNLTVSLVHDVHEAPDYFISVVEDISERKALDAELQHLTAALEERVEERTLQLANSNKELESFSYSVAHDLRAPLRGIDGWSQALLQECGADLSTKAVEYLRRVRSESQRMGELIDDMLLLSRVARADLARKSLSVSELAERVAERVLQMYPGRDIRIVVQPAIVVSADPRLLDIVLTNLIDNACKFTRTRSPATIEIGRCMHEGNLSWFVRDNGVGFDMRYAAKLFTPFQRMHRQSEYPGTGIGLATVQRIIGRHGGRVGIDSSKGSGTTVYIIM